MKKLLLVAAATLAMAACGESPTSPPAARKAATDRASNDFQCASGYVIAYDEFGNPYCVPDNTTTTTTSSTTSSTKPTSRP